MADVIKFEWEQPVEVALRYTEPRVFPSNFPGGDDRHMYSTTDGRVMYLDPLTAARIRSLDLEPGEPFWIVKRKNGRVTEYAVARPGDSLPAAAPRPIAPSGAYNGHKKALPAVKSSLPERLYYTPQSEESSLEDQLAASIDMAQRKRFETRMNQLPAVVPAPVPAVRSAVPPPPVKVPMDQAVIDAVRMVQLAMKETGEQWGDQARQDLVSTILISANRCDWLTMWKRDAQ